MGEGVEEAGVAVAEEVEVEEKGGVVVALGELLV